VARDDDEEQTDVNPAKEGELLSEVLSLEVGDKAHEACVSVTFHCAWFESTNRQCKA